MFTNDDETANNLKMIANQGQKVKYYHKITVGAEFFCSNF